MLSNEHTSTLAPRTFGVAGALALAVTAVSGSPELPRPTQGTAECVHDWRREAAVQASFDGHRALGDLAHDVIGEHRSVIRRL
jgi:hypothetical protein